MQFNVVKCATLQILLSLSTLQAVIAGVAHIKPPDTRPIDPTKHLFRRADLKSRDTSNIVSGTTGERDLKQEKYPHGRLSNISTKTRKRIKKKRRRPHHQHSRRASFGQGGLPNTLTQEYEMTCMFFDEIYESFPLGHDARGVVPGLLHDNNIPDENRDILRRDFDFYIDNLCHDICDCPDEAGPSDSHETLLAVCEERQVPNIRGRQWNVEEIKHCEDVCHCFPVMDTDTDDLEAPNIAANIEYSPLEGMIHGTIELYRKYGIWGPGIHGWLNAPVAPRPDFGQIQRPTSGKQHYTLAPDTAEPMILAGPEPKLSGAGRIGLKAAAYGALWFWKPPSHHRHRVPLKALKKREEISKRHIDMKATKTIKSSKPPKQYRYPRRQDDDVNEVTTKTIKSPREAPESNLHEHHKRMIVTTFNLECLGWAEFLERFPPTSELRMDFPGSWPSNDVPVDARRRLIQTFTRYIQMGCLSFCSCPDIVNYNTGGAAREAVPTCRVDLAEGHPNAPSETQRAYIMKCPHVCECIVSDQYGTYKRPIGSIWYRKHKGAEGFNAPYPPGPAPGMPYIDPLGGAMSQSGGAVDDGGTMEPSVLALDTNEPFFLYGKDTGSDQEMWQQSAMDSSSGGLWLGGSYSGYMVSPGKVSKRDIDRVPAASLEVKDSAPAPHSYEPVDPPSTSQNVFHKEGRVVNEPVRNPTIPRHLSDPVRQMSWLSKRQLKAPIVKYETLLECEEWEATLFQEFDTEQRSIIPGIWTQPPPSQPPFSMHSMLKRAYNDWIQDCMRFCECADEIKNRHITPGARNPKPRQCRIPLDYVIQTPSGPIQATQGWRDQIAECSELCWCTPLLETEYQEPEKEISVDDSNTGARQRVPPPGSWAAQWLAALNDRTRFGGGGGMGGGIAAGGLRNRGGPVLAADTTEDYVLWDKDGDPRDNIPLLGNSFMPKGLWVDDLRHNGWGRISMPGHGKGFKHKRGPDEQQEADKQRQSLRSEKEEKKTHRIHD